MEYLEMSRSQISPSQDIFRGKRQQMQETFEGIDHAKAAVGKKMGVFADMLRHNLTQEGSVGSATRAVADRLSAAGSYLEEHTFEDITANATSLIRRYPAQALLIGVGMGYLITRGLEN